MIRLCRENGTYSSEYANAKWAPLYALAHWGIENGLKALILQAVGQHPRGHDLYELFRLLESKDASKAKNLEHAFADIANFYTIDVDRWVHFQSLKPYLREFGKDELYEKFRYWALEDKGLYHIPLSFIENCSWRLSRYAAGEFNRLRLNVLRSSFVGHSK